MDKENQNDQQRESRFKDIILDEDFKVSSKRIIGIIGFLLLVTVFIYSMFYEVKMQEFIYDGMWILVASIFGFSAVQSFSKRKK